MCEILVDGSNALYWRGGHAEGCVPALLIRALQARRFVPRVYFDHSIGRHLPEEALSALGDLVQIIVAPRGTPADALMLAACADGRIQIVSNDRFQDWRGTHPQLRADWRVTGRIGKGGRVSFSKKLRPATI